jgi:hypothetical protein
MAKQKSKEEGSRPIAAYIPFKTFGAFIDKLHGTAVPPNIDSSVLRHMSGSMRSQLMSALRFLGLIDANGNTTESLRALVKAYKTDKWRDVLQHILYEAYDEVVGNVDLDTGTGANLDEAFRSRGSVDGQMLDKAVRFYLAALREVGQAFSPHFASRKVKKAAARKPKPASGHGDTVKDATGESGKKNTKHNDPPGRSWHEMLLEKFPSFDPKWSPEVQAKWFENFGTLMNRGDKEGESK